jgi:hypothetical protein
VGKNGMVLLKLDAKHAARELSIIVPITSMLSSLTIAFVGQVCKWAAESGAIRKESLCISICQQP